MTPQETALALAAVVTEFNSVEPGRELDISGMEFPQEHPGWGVIRAITKGRVLAFRRHYVVNVDNGCVSIHEIIGHAGTTAIEDIQYVKRNIESVRVSVAEFLG